MRAPWRRGRGEPGSSSRDRGVISATEWRQRRIRWPVLIVFGLTFVFLLIVGLGPVLWMLKASVTPTQDTLRFPMALWPHGIDLGQLAAAWNRTHIERYLGNTIVIAFGSWAIQLLVATTGGFALSILRPRFGGFLTGLVIATLFVPPIVLLVPLYLTIVDVPIVHARLIDNYWAIWLPAGASAVNVILMKRFFDNLPREILDAARVDGAGPFRLFRSVVLPMSGPILGVVSVFAVIATWKDYLWPLLVIRNPDLQPLSVRLPTLQSSTDLGVFIAALTLASIIPVVLFLVFQRLFLGGQGLSGAIKG